MEHDHDLIEHRRRGGRRAGACLRPDARRNGTTCTGRFPPGGTGATAGSPAGSTAGNPTSGGSGAAAGSATGAADPSPAAPGGTAAPAPGDGATAHSGTAG